ncbi:carboxylesterase/lipase family protein [Corallococcus silvisoli]|uniref:carboxylesterase/lipase family protein n=1 Tax=Corallococcus silvisoli TaxID=2697031 RepID=UPI0013772EC2|nr:carboxylesterase/lipase family protein [Corallococcus silvisoli]NBD10838.1 carboxylesterase family protein [Corallococcus silvisoli]
MVKQSAPVVSTVEGQLQGVAEEGVYAFKGIPYAQPPVGALRWRAPAPLAPWKYLRQAAAFGNSSLQSREDCIANGGDPHPMDEDCLYLNVWTPRVEAQAKLPVIVWIHGGAYVIGASGLPPYSGVPLASRDAVVVTLNYRLGHLGFLAHPALLEEPGGGAANFGLLDQVAALQWVHRNIARFGGDPGNVTIIGQSAGAKSVLSLFCMAAARPYFHRGVAMSVYGMDEIPLEKAVLKGEALIRGLGVPDAEATPDRLRLLPAEDFWQQPSDTSLAPVAVTGDTVLPQSILSTFKAQQQSRVPLILGSTSDDVSVMEAMNMDPMDVLRALRAQNVPIGLLYPGVTPDEELARQACRDIVFTLIPRQIADLHNKVSDAWRFYFEYTATALRPDFTHGVPHGAEIPYFLDTVARCPPTEDVLTDEDRAYSRQVSQWLLQFARTGAPAPATEWPRHQQGDDRTLRMQQPPKVETNFMQLRLNAFLLVSAIINGVGGGAEGKASSRPPSRQGTAPRKTRPEGTPL